MPKINKLEAELKHLQSKIVQAEMANHIPLLVNSLKRYYLLDISYMNQTGQPYILKHKDIDDTC